MISSFSEPFGDHHFSTMPTWSLLMTRIPIALYNTTIATKIPTTLARVSNGANIGASPPGRMWKFERRLPRERTQEGSALASADMAGCDGMTAEPGRGRMALHTSDVEVSGDEVAVIETDKGTIEFTFFPHDAPEHRRLVHRAGARGLLRRHEVPPRRARASSSRAGTRSARRTTRAWARAGRATT